MEEEGELDDDVQEDDADGGAAAFASFAADLRLLTSTSTVSRMTSPQEEATELDDSELVREPSL